MGRRSKLKYGGVQSMSDVIKGTVAGGVATAALSAVMLLIGATGFEPQLELTRLLLTLLDEPPSLFALGWTLHIVIGSLGFGALFAYIEPRLGADTHTKSGILFGVLTWLVMMLVIMPAAGLGYFGFQVSHLAPIVMLVQQVLYGAVLGWFYGKLSPTHNPFTKHHPA
jgi:Family of unknown function (DUF6789)